MTVFAPFGRVLSQRVGGRSNYLVTRLYTQPSLSRASCCNHDGPSSSPWACSNSLQTNAKSAIGARSYATSTTTEAAKPAGRPKAHTGRSLAKKSTTTKSTSTKRAAAGQKGGKAAPARKTRAKAKPAKKPAKKTVKVKAKPKKRVLTEAGLKKREATKQRERVAELKAKALLDEPKKLPAHNWLLYLDQNRKKSTSLADTQAQLKELGEQFRHITPAQREALNHTTNENKKKNETAYKSWVSAHTPQQVKDANNARRLLSTLQASKSGKTTRQTKLIKDDRLVKQPWSSYTFFYQERFASGDFRSVAVPEAARLIGREFKALDSSQRNVFDDRAKQDKQRYIEEHTTVYGVPPPHATS